MEHCWGVEPDTMWEGRDNDITACLGWMPAIEPPPPAPPADTESCPSDSSVQPQIILLSLSQFTVYCVLLRLVFCM